MKRVYPTLAGLVLSAGLLVTTAVAQAAPTSPAIARAPHAPAATVSPTISPAAFSVTHLPQDRPNYTCPLGELCLQVYDPATEGTIVFALYYCKTYTLYNWNGSGTYRDNQTGGVRTVFVGPPNTYIWPDGGTLHQFNWTPINQIISC